MLNIYWLWKFSRVREKDNMKNFPLRRQTAGDNCLSTFLTYMHTQCVHVCARASLYISAILEERGKRYEVHGLKREVVISPGWVPDTLVKLPCGLIIINRVEATWLTLQTVSRHCLRIIPLFAYFSSTSPSNRQVGFIAFSLLNSIYLYTKMQFFLRVRIARNDVS